MSDNRKSGKRRSQLNKLTLVVPSYNEKANLPELCDHVTAACSKLPLQLEFLIIDDGSTDGTLQWLRERAATDLRILFISFSRNFGHRQPSRRGFGMLAAMQS